MHCSVYVSISMYTTLYGSSKKGLTALTIKGAIPSTNATPPMILFLLERAYMRRVVNTDHRILSVSKVVQRDMQTYGQVRSD